MSRRKGLLSLLAVLLLCVVAVTPLLRGDSACTHDSGLHYYRIVAMRSALDQGLLFTRWLPDLAFGYGYPFFNYRASVSYYLGLGLYLTGLPLPLALDLVYVLSILGCAVGAFLLARDIFGPEAGFVAAIAYAYAPYQFLDALLRANAPESVALALMPFLLWACRRLALQGGRHWFLTTTLLMTVFFLTHAISNLLFLPFLLAYCVALALAHGRTGNWGWVILAIGFALTITSFYWLPALAEQQYAQLQMSRVTRNNDFHYNFLDLAEILSVPAVFDTSLLNPPMRIQLGFGQTVLALLGLGFGVSQWRVGKAPGIDPGRINLRRERMWSLIFFSASALLLIFMSTAASVWLWENVPLLSFVQFPWRLIGRAALPVALLASAPFACSPELPKRPGAPTLYILAGAVALLILLAIPQTYPPLGYCPADSYPTVQDIHEYEHSTRLVGVDPEGSYFPVWVEQRPNGSPLEVQYSTGETIARFDEDSLPEGATLLQAEYGPNRAHLLTDSPTPFRARYLTFYFPGWEVEVDGEPAEAVPSDPEGLITFAVPAGQHKVTISFGETPLRLAVDLLSVISLILLALATLRMPQPEIRQDPAAQSAAPVWPLFVVAILLAGLKIGVIDRVDSIFRRPLLESQGTLPGVSVPLDIEYTDGITLIGYDLREDEAATDGTLRVDLYWTARQQPSERYEIVVQLVGPDGFLWSYQNSYRPRGYHRPIPTYNWGPGRYAMDSHEVEPLPGTLPGKYELVVTIFDRNTLVPLSVLDEMGQPTAPELILQEVTLVRSQQPSRPSLPNRIDLEHGELTLLSASFDRDQAAPGDPVRLTTTWRAEAPDAEAFLYPASVTIALTGPNGQTRTTYQVPTAPSWYPTEDWIPGDVWLGQSELTLPADLESGTHTWYAELDDSTEYVLQQLSVAAPDHSFTAPAPQHQVGITIGDLATLVGIDLAADSVRPGDGMTITLVWRAEDTGSASYHVFLHLLDQDGVVVAQSDGIPASWTRPTTGWLAGEYVIDVRTLDLPSGIPPGEYSLSTGLYIPGGDRLRSLDGLDAIWLLAVEVEKE